MKYLKILGLAAIAATALMALAGTASATTLTSPAGTQAPAGTVIHMESEGQTVFDTAIGKIQCNATTEGKTANTGSGTETVKVDLPVVSFTTCTSGPFILLQHGTLEIHAVGGGNGSVTSTGTELTTEKFGLHCIYKTTNTPLGTLTGGTPAKLDISATIPRTGGRSGIFCESSGSWTGSFKVTAPSPLLVD